MEYLDGHEKIIVKAILDEIAARDWAVRLHDGEEWSTNVTKDRAEIERLIDATELTRLFVYPAPMARIGWIDLIIGNGEDLISDTSDNAEIEEFLQAAQRRIGA